MSIVEGWLHTPALSVNTRPNPSTARQSDSVGQDTEFRGGAISTTAGWLHEPPVSVSARELESTATHCAALGQDTELSPFPPSAVWTVHDAPLKAAT